MTAGDAFIDVSDLVNIMTGSTAETINFTKTGTTRNGTATTTPVIGRISSCWLWDGQPGGANLTLPTTAVALNNTTAGGFQNASPATGAKKYILGAAAAALVTGTLMIYDRLGQTGGLSGTLTGAQTTNLPTAALTRRTSGVGVETWLEIYTAIGTTATTIATSYTNSTGTTGRTSALSAFGATGRSEADRILPQPLASGDRGVRAVASVSVTGTTVTAGNFGVTLAYPLVNLPMALAGVGTLWSAFLQNTGPLSLEANGAPCIALAWLAGVATTPQIFGQAFFGEK